MYPPQNIDFISPTAFPYIPHPGPIPLPPHLILTILDLHPLPCVLHLSRPTHAKVNLCPKHRQTSSKKLHHGRAVYFPAVFLFLQSTSILHMPSLFAINYLFRPPLSTVAKLHLAPSRNSTFRRWVNLSSSHTICVFNKTNNFRTLQFHSLLSHAHRQASFII